VVRPFANPFRVISVFNHSCKQGLVAPFIFLCMIIIITANHENQALLVSFRRKLWRWQDAA